jgi:rubrerythrin
MTGIDKKLGTIQQAIELEKFGYEFYSNMRTFVKDKEGHKLISQLANLEIDHMKWLEGEYKNQLERLTDFQEGGAIDILISGKEEIFFKDKLPEIFREFDAIKALDFAIEIEEKSAEFYEQNLDLVEDASIKSLFQKLADFEKKHKEVLIQTRDNLKIDDSWIRATAHILW